MANEDLWSGCRNRLVLGAAVVLVAILVGVIALCTSGGDGDGDAPTSAGGAVATATPATAATPEATSAAPEGTASDVPTILEGQLLDGDVKPLRIAGIVVRVGHQSGGEGFRATTDEEGQYSGELTPGGGEVYVYIQGVDETTWYTSNGDTIEVETGTTERFDPNALGGYHLEVTSVSGISEPTAGDTTYTVTVGYRVWNPIRAPGATTFLAVGTTEEDLAVHEIGATGTWEAPNERSEGNAELVVPLPADRSGETLTAYARLLPARTEVEARDAWPSGFPTNELFVPIASVVVP